MLKKLDKLIIKAFIGPFAATFFITLLVLVMQFFWLWIDDFVGKGLSPGIIFEFIWYQGAALVPLALPLAVLLSSIMTFGNLGESYELVAIKSAGISLLRFMRPLTVVTLLICFVAFLFANYIIPIANLKSRTLLSDIVNANPSFDLKEGVFYDKLNGMAIKIGKKVNDSVIQNIIIYEQNNSLQDNFIVASDGVMKQSPNLGFLEFNLRNGTRYEERGTSTTAATEYIRLSFKEYKRQFDLRSFGLQQRSADSNNRNNAKMFSMRQLGVAIDSLKKVNKTFNERVKQEVVAPVILTRYLDSNWKKQEVKTKPVKNIEASIPDSIKSTIEQRALSRISNMRMSNDGLVTDYKEKQKNLWIHEIEWHRKISLSFACLVLYLIGAPLGSIIRKGGLGSPLVFAIIFFMLFYFSSTTGEKFAKEGSVLPWVGMWMSTFVLLPIAIFLIYKASGESQLFNKEYYYRLWRKIKNRLPGKA